MVCTDVIDADVRSFDVKNGDVINADDRSDDVGPGLVSLGAHHEGGSLHSVKQQ